MMDYPSILFTLKNPELYRRRPPYQNDFKLPANVIDDTFVNPTRLVTGIAPEIKNLFRCHNCLKFPPQAVYECVGEGHILCGGCHQFMRGQNCRAKVEGKICGKRLREMGSKALTELLQRSKFTCVYPACHEAVGGGEEWSQHLDNCTKNDFLKCPDHHCNGKVIRKKDFIQHCQDIHQIPLTPEGPYFLFHFEKPATTSTSKNPTIVLLFKVTDHLLYLVAHFIPPQSILFSCFLMDRDVELVKKQRVEIAPLLTGPSKFLVRGTTRVNVPGRELNELKYFGRSAIFLVPELNAMFGFGKEKPGQRQVYNFSLKLKQKDVKKKMQLHPPLETDPLTGNIRELESSSVWKPLPQELKLKLKAKIKAFLAIVKEMREKFHQHQLKQAALLAIKQEADMIPKPYSSDGLSLMERRRRPFGFRRTVEEKKEKPLNVTVITPLDGVFGRAHRPDLDDDTLPGLHFKNVRVVKRITSVDELKQLK